MGRSLVEKIVSILNDNSTNSEKVIALREESTHRRGENREIIAIISNILSIHLPIRIKQKVDYLSIEKIHLEKLEKILGLSTNPYFNAVCSEVLWQCTHQIRFAVNALNEYHINVRQLYQNNDDHIAYTKMSISICRIYAKCHSKEFAFHNFIDESINYITSHIDSSGYSSLFILEALTKCKERLEDIEQVYAEAIDHLESIKKYDAAIKYLKSLEKFTASKDKKQKHCDIQIKMAKIYEQHADSYSWDDPQYAHLIIRLIQNAMREWKRADVPETKANRQRLAKRIIPVKKLSLTLLKEFTIDPIDISNWMEDQRKYIEKSTLEAVMWRLIRLYPLSDFNTEKDALSSQGPFINMVSSNILDHNGRTKCVIPPVFDATAKELICIAEHSASERYRRFSSFVWRYIMLAKEKFEFTSHTLRFLFEDNAFVQPDRIDSFSKGIAAGFNMDWSTAMHLLMPQVEHSLRCIAEDCGAVTYKTEDDGTEESLSLSSILSLPEVKECFDEAFLFNLRVFYTSTYGFGMRNVVCHGLYSDRELQSGSCIAVWWFTLYICCIFSPHLYERIALQNDEQNNTN